MCVDFETRPFDLPRLFGDSGRLHYFCRPEKAPAFEELYLAVRKKEGRVYSGKLIRQLPEVPRGHPHYREWEMRKHIFQKLRAYLAAKQRPLTILDLGCGNGWMSDRLARIAQCRVCAMDLNCRELQQGARLFTGNRQLVFIYGNIFQEIFPEACFDIIVLASSLQYFPNLTALLKRLLALLRKEGEIHLLDSPFYTEASLGGAVRRSRAYYDRLGFPEMAAHYHHHCWGELTAFHPLVLYDPRSIFSRMRRQYLRRYDSPFPWIRINHHHPPAS